MRFLKISIVCSFFLCLLFLYGERVLSKFSGHSINAVSSGGVCTGEKNIFMGINISNEILSL